ncbi:MAG: spheroidene monooxygenase, partial [Segetibacter sp.]|nr:spheroidene monooxygenase [Segetibacter sp.]
MYATLTIVRYPKWLAWAGFLSMACFRLPFLFNKKATFYKLLGCGKNGTFDKVPDVRQWGVLMVTSSLEEIGINNEGMDYAILYGSFISNWWKFFKCSIWTLVLQPIEGHGTWDSREAFGSLPRNSTYDGMIAVLTRATIRIH